MSDFGRKPVSSQISQSLQPDSTKSTTDKLGENISGAADRAGSVLQPNSQKSGTQAAADGLRGGKDDVENKGTGVVETVKDYANTAAKAAADAVNSLTGNNNGGAAGSNTNTNSGL